MKVWLLFVFFKCNMHYNRLDLSLNAFCSSSVFCCLLSLVEFTKCWKTIVFFLIIRAVHSRDSNSIIYIKNTIDLYAFFSKVITISSSYAGQTLCAMAKLYRWNESGLVVILQWCTMFARTFHKMRDWEMKYWNERVKPIKCVEIDQRKV